jgi:tetratricopeptide (TPR) repeat protein
MSEIPILQRLWRQILIGITTADLARAQRFGEDERVIEDLLELGRIHSDQGQWDVAERLTEDARRRAVARGNEFQVAHADFQLGCAFEVRGDFDSARAAFEAATPPLRRLGDSQVLADTLLKLGFIYDKLGRGPDAVALWRESVEQARAGHHAHTLAIALSNLGNVYFRDRHYEEARRHWREAADLSERTRDYERVANTKFFLGLASRNLGQLDTARRFLSESKALYRRLGRVDLSDRSDGYLAELGGDLAPPAH